MLHRGALDAAQCHKAFGQVVLRLFPCGVAVASQGALLDRIFSESDQDLDGLLLFHEFQAFVLRGLQPLLRGHAKQSASLQAALPRALDYHAKTLQSHLPPQAVPAMPTQAQAATAAATGASSGAFAPALSGLKDLGASSRVMSFASKGGLARELTQMLQEYEIPEVSENLGSGAFGTVLKVKHYGTGETRACKAVRLDQGSQQLKELVELEVTMLKSLDHVNLLRLHEAFRDGQRCVYLITELCAGGSLAERLEGQRRTQRATPFFEGQSAAYAEQMLSAASYCHQRGVLHRDLKPENVLFLTPLADSPVKVIDFGLSDTLERLRQNATEELQDRRGALGAVARLLPKLPGGLEILATKVTKEVMQRAGTPHYMAPEVYEGQYGEKADVWSIGVMIFEMLTNRHPFYTVGNDLDAVRRRILSPKGADFEADAAWRQVTPAALRACQAALRPQVARRPSAKELLNDTWFETVPRLALGVSGYSSGSMKTATAVQPQQVIEAMRRFTFPGYIGSTRIRLRQAFLRLLVYELPEAVLAPLRGAFLRLDRDSDGLLSAADLHGAGAGGKTTTSSSFLDALFGEASASPEDEEIRSLLAVSGGANGLGFSDFVAVMMPFCVSLEEAQCRLAFQRLAGAEVTLSRMVLVDTVQVGPDVPQAEVEAFHAGLPEELTFADFLELVRT